MPTQMLSSTSAGPEVAGDQIKKIYNLAQRFIRVTKTEPD